MSKLPISVCMIAKNEEKYLGGCLEKLVPYGFEIIVADTGSTDKTKEIALKHTEHVYDFPWIDDFSAARNFSASKASNDWILVLDCDEYIKDFNPQDLLDCLKGREKMAGQFVVDNLIRDGEGVGKSQQTVRRLYNKKYCHFEGMIHEQIRSINNEPLYLFDLPIRVIHYGYFLSNEEMEAKNQRYIALLKKEIEADPKQPYYYFQLGQSYAMLNDYENVFQVLQQGLALDPNPQDAYVSQMLINYGTAMLNTGRYALAMNMELLYDSLCDFSDYLFLLGRIYYANGKYFEALQSFMKATAAPKCIVYGTNSFFPLNSMALVYDQIGEKELAKECREQLEKLVSGLKSEVDEANKI